ncbi:MAG: hypothetical protein WBE26_03530 [Phycisphaerae bacterium]
MNKYDERTPAARARDKRIAALEKKVDGILMDVRNLDARLQVVYSRVSAEVARQATDLGAELAHQFAAARRREMQELAARVLALEAWTQEMDEMDVVPIEPPDSAQLAKALYGEEYASAEKGGMGTYDDGYEDPGPASISPQG